MGWKAYFDIFPFNQDREDRRAAELLSALATFASGKAVDPMSFMPDYLGLRRPQEKSIEQQRADKEAFKAKLKAAQKGIT